MYKKCTCNVFLVLSLQYQFQTNIHYMKIQKYIDHRAKALEKILFTDRTGQQQHKRFPQYDYANEVAQFKNFCIKIGAKGLIARGTFSYFTI